jgi:hypothetical protein
VVVFKFNSKEQIDKIYKNYCTNLFDSLQTFQKILNLATKEEYSCLVMAPQKGKYWYYITQPPSTEPKKFGCKEIWEYNNKYLDINKQHLI